MARAVARPQDVLLGYEPGRFEGEDAAYPFEITGGAFPELEGEPDDYYDDFSSALQDYLAVWGGGGRGLYGGRGADPAAVVWGADFLSDGESEDGERPGGGAAAEGPPSPAAPAEDGGLSAHVVDTPPPGEGRGAGASERGRPLPEAPAGDGDLSAHVVDAPSPEEGPETGPGGRADLSAHVVDAPFPEGDGAETGSDDGADLSAHVVDAGSPGGGPGAEPPESGAGAPPPDGDGP